MGLTNSTEFDKYKAKVANIKTKQQMIEFLNSNFRDHIQFRKANDFLGRDCCKFKHAVVDDCGDHYKLAILCGNYVYKIYF